MSAPGTLPPYVVAFGEIIEAAADRGALKALERAGEFFRPAPPTLLDTAGIARELGVSDVHVRKLTNKKENGMPFVRVGDCRRYELAAVLEWLRAQPKPESEADQ
ncbi:MAG TPA: helix-turn-helix domain-containing protein [Polyangiaceae bacterium]|nr:helix-turn-helix domain-containing protein [Polyangiaceae bacterium]